MRFVVSCLLIAFTACSPQPLAVDAGSTGGGLGGFGGGFANGGGTAGGSAGGFVNLRIKRERLVREVRVDDPLAWLNQVVTKVSGLVMNLQSVEFLEEANTLLCMSGDHETRIFVSPFSPKEIQRIKRERRSRLSQFDKNNPLLFLSRMTIAYEFSVLNAGILFDLELQLAWKGLTGREIDQHEKLWMYKD